MAGYTIRSLDNTQSTGMISNIQRNIRYWAAIGTNWDKQLIKQSKSIGIAEAQIDSMYNMYHANAAYAGLDYGQKEFIAFYDKEYPTRRDFLRKFSMNGEIEHVLEVISDESIVLDENNYFAYPSTKILKSVIKQDKAKEVVDDINESFKKAYFAFGFLESSPPIRPVFPALSSSFSFARAAWIVPSVPASSRSPCAPGGCCKIGSADATPAR